MKLTGGEILLKTLVSLEVDTIFGIPGGVVLPLYDSFRKFKKIRHVLVRHEQAAAFAADGYARVTGKVGVCIGTSGPGATNLITGIAGAYMDSVPILVLTGQVASNLIGSDAFQEVDSIGVTLPIVKHSFLAQSPSEVADMVTTAYYIARSGRPGPVHVDLTKDAFMRKVTYKNGRVMKLPGYKIPRMNLGKLRLESKKLDTLLDKDDARPIILAGHGIEIAGAEKEFFTWAKKLDAPVVNTLLGMGTFPQDHRQWLGLVGMHGTAVANKALAKSNIVIAVGMRFDDRVTGALDSFIKNKKFVHFEIDESEVGKIIYPEIVFLGDVKETLKQSFSLLKNRKQAWWKEIDSWRKKYPPLALAYPQKAKAPLSSAWVVEQLSKLTKGEDIVASDVGRHQMWIARYYQFRHSRSHLSHGGLGSMGYGAPAAMGAKFGQPMRRVWAVSGDGSFQMNLQELATIVENNIDIKIIILNDSSLGMVRQWQELFFGSNLASSVFTHNPDFVKLAESFGIPGRRIERPRELQLALQWAGRHRGPVLLDVIIDKEEHVYPMVPAGKGLHEQIVSDPRREKNHRPVKLQVATSD